jgi:hypothetical protein
MMISLPRKKEFVMAQNEARRQKQLAKKKAKRDEKRTQMVRANSDNPLIRLAAAESWPIAAAWMPDNLWSQGIGQLILARRQPDGRLACGVFLVDIYCLGVKNAFWKILTESEYDTVLKISDKAGQLRKVAPEYLAKLVQDAVQYAQGLGFPPHPDYAHARLLLAGIDPSLCTETFEFGKDGNPYYFRGPHESLEKAQVIARRIQMAGGHFTVPLKASEQGEPMKALDELGGNLLEVPR